MQMTSPGQMTDFWVRGREGDQTAFFSWRVGIPVRGPSLISSPCWSGPPSSRPSTCTHSLLGMPGPLRRHSARRPSKTIPYGQFGGPALPLPPLLSTGNLDLPRHVSPLLTSPLRSSQRLPPASPSPHSTPCPPQGAVSSAFPISHPWNDGKCTAGQELKGACPSRGEEKGGCSKQAQLRGSWG